MGAVDVDDGAFGGGLDERTECLDPGRPLSPGDESLHRLHELEAVRRRLARELEEQRVLRASLMALHEPHALEAERRILLRLPHPRGEVELVVTQSSGTALGGLLWAPGTALAEYLVTTAPDWQSARTYFAPSADRRPLRVLELGCGVAALPSCAAAAAFGASVLATDVASVVPLALASFAQNEGRLSLEEGACVQIAEYEWNEVVPPPGAPYDLVLGADLLYHEEAQTSLAAALAAAVGDSGIALLAYEARRSATEAQFFTRLRALGARTQRQVAKLPPEQEGRGTIYIVEVSFRDDPSARSDVSAEDPDVGIYL